MKLQRIQVSVLSLLRRNRVTSRRAGRRARPCFAPERLEVRCLAAADAPLTAQSWPIVGNENQPLKNPSLFIPPDSTGASPRGPIVAYFEDADPNSSANDFMASIDWGDGTPPSLGDITAQGVPGNGPIYRVTGDHTYAEEGSYTVTVVVNDIDFDGTGIVTTGLATIADTPPVLTPVPFTIPEGRQFAGPVATISELTEPTVPETPQIQEPPTDFRATIDWGDGSPLTEGTIVSQSGELIVTGQHMYADAGSNTSSVFPVTVTVFDDGGSFVRVVSQGTVTDVPIHLTGFLNPASDSGVSHSDGITNVTQPSFFGMSEPDSVIRISAISQLSPGTIIPLGQVAADASGAWSLTSEVALSDGSYTIVALAVDHAGNTTASTQFTPDPATGKGLLVIDTTGPKVSGIKFDRSTSKITITLQDHGGGLDQSTLLDGSSYRFWRPGVKRGDVLVTGVTMSSQATSNTGQTVSLILNNGKRIKNGSIFGTVVSGGIRDIAGNALDGEFYGTLASGNNKPGGDFQARIDLLRNGSMSLRPIDSTVSPVAHSVTPVTKATTGAAVHHGHASASALGHSGSHRTGSHVHDSVIATFDLHSVARSKRQFQP
jgi:hypothetical protein